MTTDPARPVLAIWHGYLLNATGSNIYTHHLVRSWIEQGHDVVLACQEPDPSAHPSIHEVVRLAWNADRTEQVVASRTGIRDQQDDEGRCTMVVPDIDAVLPVYVLDRYAGFDVHRLVDLDEAARERYAAAQAATMQYVLREHAPAGVLINHASPLPAALAPVLVDAGVPYAVKVHGSELEYALVEDPSLVPAAARALTSAASVLVGSDHITRRTIELLGDACVEGRIAVVPPGVELDHFTPSPAGIGGDVAGRAALRAVVESRAFDQSAGRDADVRRRVEELVDGADDDAAALLAGLAELPDQYEERHVEGTAAAQLAAIPPEARLVTFVGKLIAQKGVHLLLAALPDVLAAHPDAHLVVAGFGPQRDALEALLVAMDHGNVAAIDELANRAGTLTGEGSAQLVGLPEHLAHLRATGRFDAWLGAAREHRVADRVTWVGLVDHAILRLLWPQCEISVVPSILAEAFGMVAAEAAACGCVPLVADHSGLADAARVIEADGVAPVRVGFDPLDQAVTALADALVARLALPREELERQSTAARTNVARAWGWDALAIEVAELMTGRATAAH